MTPFNSATFFARRKRQSGFGLTGWLAVIVAATIIGKFGIAVGPAMYENYLLRDTLKTIAELPNLKDLSKGDLQKRINNAFTVNNIRAVPSNAVQFRRGDNKSWIIEIYWVSFEPFVGDFYVSNVFFNRLDTARPDECCALEHKEKKKLKEELLAAIKAVSRG